MKRPIVMFEDTRGRKNLALLRSRQWSRIFASQRPTPFPFEKWGFDDGAYKAWQDAGFPIGLTVDEWCALFSLEEFEHRLEEAEAVGSEPYVAVVPKIPGSSESLAYSVERRKDLMNGWPWYLAVQDGMTVEAVEDVLHMFAGIFFGGTGPFRLTAQRWARLAHKHHRRFHYSRAGTLKRVRHAFAVGADSLDSTYACWTKEQTKELWNTWDSLGLQSEM